MDYGVGDHLNGRLGLRTAVWLQTKVRECGLKLWSRLNASRVCDDSTAKAAYVALSQAYPCLLNTWLVGCQPPHNTRTIHIN